MSKTQKIKPVDFEKNIMAKVKSNKISMKPRWYFIMGSMLTFTGLVGVSVVAVFLTNLTLFLLRKHGPMGQWRLQLMFGSFPWWIPIFAVIGMVVGIWMLKQYDFSYKKNFWFIVMGFILVVMCAAYFLDSSGLNDIWSRQGPMRRFYQQIKEPDSAFPRGSNYRGEKWK